MNGDPPSKGWRPHERRQRTKARRRQKKEGDDVYRSQWLSFLCCRSTFWLWERWVAQCLCVVWVCLSFSVAWLCPPTDSLAVLCRVVVALSFLCPFFLPTTRTKTAHLNKTDSVAPLALSPKQTARKGPSRPARHKPPKAASKQTLAVVLVTELQGPMLFKQANETYTVTVAQCRCWTRLRRQRLPRRQKLPGCPSLRRSWTGTSPSVTDKNINLPSFYSSQRKSLRYQKWISNLI